MSIGAAAKNDTTGNRGGGLALPVDGQEALVGHREAGYLRDQLEARPVVLGQIPLVHDRLDHGQPTGTHAQRDVGEEALGAESHEDGDDGLGEHQTGQNRPALDCPHSVSVGHPDPPLEGAVDRQRGDEESHRGRDGGPGVAPLVRPADAHQGENVLGGGRIDGQPRLVVRTGATGWWRG